MDKRLFKAVDDHDFQQELKQFQQKKTKPKVQVKRVVIDKEGKSPQEWIISADLHNVPLFEVIERISLNYILHKGNLSGRVSARFEKMLLPNALNTLLESSGLHAKFEEDLVIFDKTHELENGNVFDEYYLRFVDTEFAKEMLSKIDEDDDTEFTFLIRSNTNSIYLYGDETQVSQAIEILKRIDQEPKHVLIEARVVQFDTEAIINLGAELSAGQRGNYFDVGIDFSNLLGRTISFTMSADEAFSKAFTASINILLQNNKAKIISKPYLITLSGKNALMEVTDDRYVPIRNNDEISLEEVNSGIFFDITPIDGQIDGKIQLDIKITSSTFVLSEGNVTLQRRRRTVNSSRSYALQRSNHFKSIRYDFC